MSTELMDRHQAMWRAYRATSARMPQPQATPSKGTARSRTLAAASDSLLLVKLETDLNRLALQPSREARTQLQGELLKSPMYADYLSKVLVGKGVLGEDPVLIRCMIWAFNVRDMALAMQLAEIAYKRALAMPDEFKASVVVFMCREVAYWALAEQKEGRSPQPYLNQVWEKSRHWDKPDQIEARLLKAKGQDIQAENPQAALKLYQDAQHLDRDVGVSHMIKRLQKQLLA